MAALISLTGISLQIPEKIFGAPDWYAEHCWFANWRNPGWEIDCATNVPVAAYYSGHPVIGMREADRGVFLDLIRRKGCLIAGVDYYANTALSPFIFPRLFERYNEPMYRGAVVYLKICLQDSLFTYSILGSSVQSTGN